MTMHQIGSNFTRNRSQRGSIVILVSLISVFSLILTSQSYGEEPQTNDIRSKRAYEKIMLDLSRDPNIVNSLLVVNGGDRKKSFAVASGFADPVEQIPVSDKHQFHIASMTKSFTAVVMLQLVEEGYFTLDSTLGELFGKKTVDELFPNHAFQKIDGSGKRVGGLVIDQLQQFAGVSMGQNITVRQLLQHTHGMPDLTFDAPLGKESLATYVIADTLGFDHEQSGISRILWSGERLLEYYLASGLARQSMFLPGNGYHYGDTGFVVAGLMIESVTGMSLAEAYRSRIFEPLGMQDSYLQHYEEARSVESIGVAHRFIDLSAFGHGIGNVDVDQENWNTSIDWAGGGLVSTAADLDRFLRGLFTRELLKDENTVAEILQGVPGDSDSQLYGLGFGLVLNEARTEVIGVEHGGFWGSYMLYVPSKNTTLVMTVNQVEADAGQAIERLRDQVTGQGRHCRVVANKMQRRISKLKRKISQKNRIIRTLKAADGR